MKYGSFSFHETSSESTNAKQLPYNYWLNNKIVIAYDIRQLAKTKMILIVRSAVENTEVIFLKEAKLMHTVKFTCLNMVLNRRPPTHIKFL